MRSTLLTPRQAATLLDVSESTVRRWCDAGQLEGSKTTGGHRRITLHALLEFAKTHDLTVVTMGPATTAGQGGRLLEPSELARRFYDQLSASWTDQNATDFALNVIGQLGEVETFCDQVMSPSLRRIGEEWTKGMVPVHREHRATQECLHALLAAHSQFPRSSSQKIAICAGLSNDPYAVAPLMCSLALRSAGYNSVHLGPDSPSEEVLSAAVENRAVLIAISVGVEPEGAHKLSALCEKANSLGIRVALGGRCLSSALRQQLKPDFFGDNMAHLVAYSKRLIKVLL